MAEVEPKKEAGRGENECGTGGRVRTEVEKEVPKDGGEEVEKEETSANLSRVGVGGENEREQK